MRLTLWQQFSSNHSAYFTVVGVFASEQTAETAAHDLSTVFDRIEGWYEEHGYGSVTEKQRANQGRIIPPSDAEIKLTEELGLEWKQGIDWFMGREREEYPVTRFHNMVFVESVVPHTYQGPHPFDDLLKRYTEALFIAASECHDYPNTLVTVDIQCIAPTPAVAEQIKRQIEEYFEHDSNLLDPLLLDDCSFVDGLSCNVVEVSGQHCKFKHLFFLGIPTSLPPFIAYLEGQGCTDFRYEFHTFPF